VTSPVVDSVVSGSEVVIAGRTTPGSDISINGSPIYTDNDGAFSEKVALQDGVNQIQVISKSKLGKSTVVTRNLLAKIPEVDSTVAAVPNKTFDGVAVAVSVDSATEVIIKVDGQEKFRGLILAGKSRLFSGAREIVVTTANAGATSLTVTNSLVAGKRLGALGADGETRSNLIFAKDTNIQ